MITGATHVAAVIGWPIAHSRSPAIHNAAAKATGADLVYVALPVAPGRAAEAVEAARMLGIRGLSVTMPHKDAVIPALDEITPIAKTLGAVNHITNNDGQLVGNNTDGDGFLVGLAHYGVSIDGATVGVVGSGGAARAIIEACARHGANVVVVARNAERAAAAAAVGGPGARVADMAELAHADVVVNATPLGMATADQSMVNAVPFDPTVLSLKAVVVDIVYNPLETALLARSRARGLQCVDGLAMLVGQAAVQFEAWVNQSAPIDVMMRAAEA